MVRLEKAQAVMFGIPIRSGFHAQRAVCGVWGGCQSSDNFMIGMVVRENCLPGLGVFLYDYLFGGEWCILLTSSYPENTGPGKPSALLDCPLGLIG